MKRPRRQPPRIVATPAEAPRKAKSRWPPLTYVVEVESTTPDPKVAAQVLAWLRARQE